MLARNVERLNLTVWAGHGGGFEAKASRKSMAVCQKRRRFGKLDSASILEWEEAEFADVTWGHAALGFNARATLPSFV